MSAIASVLAQTDTGTISGVVTDASGAVIPNAEVKASNLDTGSQFRTVSGENGFYALNALPRGTYTLSVSAPGFATASRPGVVVNVNSRLEVGFQLRPGEVTETIEVTGETPLLETESGSLGQVVENKTLITLPLNGRNYSQLAVLAPGVTPNAGSRAADGFSINGNRTFQNVFLVDGIDNNNYILGVDTNSTQALRPSVDAIQEFKLETANYSAEFGRAAGGVISVSIKSGTNNYRGSVFEFLRNEKLDANDFFSNRAGLRRPPLRRNQAGGTLGGPIVRNRTFFFASYQGTFIREPLTQTTTVPVGAMARGDFGDVRIFDPLNVAGGRRMPFPNNVIPGDRLDPVGSRLAELYPAPNQPGQVNNWVANIPLGADEHQADARLDHRLSNANSLFLRFSRLDRENNRGPFFAPPGNGGNGFNDFPLIQLPKAWSVALNNTHIFTPALVNEFRVGFTRNTSDQLSPAREPLFDEFGIRGIPPSRGLTGLPTFSVTGFSQLGDRTFAPNPKLTEVLQFIDNVSWVRGQHTVKFGIDSRFMLNFAGTSNTARGSFSFNGQFTSEIPGTGTGNGLADLLLGQTNNATLTTLLRGDFRQDYHGLFINDTWKLHRRLTVNLGIRYELQSPPREADNRQANFDLDHRNATFGMLVPATDDRRFGGRFVARDKNNWAPRVGFAWQWNERTVVRGSGGIFYGSFGYLAIAQMLAANPPNFLSVSVPTASTAARSALVLSEGFPAGFLDPARVRNPNIVAFLPNWPLPEVYQWNFSLQRELPGSFVTTLAYVGSGSSYLPGINNVNDPPPGPGAINPRRPFPEFGSIILNSSFAHATYHSFQAKAERRFVSGFSFLGSYTWAKSIDNSTNGEDTGNGPVQPMDPRNTRIEKGNSAIDVRHRFVASGIYELPFGRGKRFVSQRSVASAVLGGWQVGGIFTASSGTWQSPSLAPNTANTTGPLRPNRIAEGNLPAGERTIDRWFDVSAFPAPPPFAYGNSGRNVLRMPGLLVLDALIGRSFALGESRRLDLRAEFFNFTNTPQWGRPNLNVAQPQAGRITNTSVPNRQVQLGIRIAF